MRGSEEKGRGRRGGGRGEGKVMGGAKPNLSYIHNFVVCQSFPVVSTETATACHAYAVQSVLIPVQHPVVIMVQTQLM